MAILFNDPEFEAEIIAERQARHIDQFDEVWDGLYRIFPPKDNEHQEVRFDLMLSLTSAIPKTTGAQIYPGVNVSDHQHDWEHNFRCPDVVVYLKETSAINCRTHYCGGPDFGVEIVSPHDCTHEKFDFYASVGTRELLIVDRDPWCLELYRLRRKRLVLEGRSTLEQPRLLASEMIPLSFRLIPGDERPQVEILHSDRRQCWVV